MIISWRIPTSLAFLFWMTILTGLAYPLVVTGIVQLAFPGQANGSLIEQGGVVKGSRLLGQDFASDRFFRGRPSASGYAYLGSGGSNLAPTNAALAKIAEERGIAWAKRFGGTAPADMRYASASGLDPDISLESALGQMDAVAAARNLGTAGRKALAGVVRALAADTGNAIGSPRVNVVELNARLEADSAFADVRR